MILRNISVILTLSLTLAVSVFPCRGAGLKVDGLKCEYQANPLGLDTPQPRLSWLLESPERGQRQTAYQVLAATSTALLSAGKADLWDSGKVPSAQSVHVVYGGQPLHPGQRVYWKLRTWDRDDRPSAYSASAWWEMGMLTPADWRAAWITRKRTAPLSEQQLFKDDPAPLFRKEFSIEKKISRARAYVSGLGIQSLCADVGATCPGGTVDDYVATLMRYDNGARGNLWVTNAAAGSEHGLSFRIHGDKGALEWHQEEPNRLLHRRGDGFDQVLTRRLGPLMSEGARRSIRVERGHPEGYLEAFANLYTEFAQVVAARIAGQQVPELPRLYPQVQDGVQGLSYVAAALHSAQTGTWASVGDVLV